MEPAQSRWILAHELAHIRRRDHVVRWLEWLACTVYWWNPTVWWTRRRLRFVEEICCDAMVVQACDAAPRAYASALMRAIDLVRTGQAPRFPTLASAADSDRRMRILERRLRMIMTNRPNSTRTRALRPVVRSGFVAVMALGLVYCGEQRSPTALELPGSELPLADEELDQLADYVTGPLNSLLSPVQQDRRWTGPRAQRRRRRLGRSARPSHDLGWGVHRTRIGIDSCRLRPTEYRIGSRRRLWTSIAQRTASDQDAEFLVARKIDGGEWTFLDKVPEASSSTLHLIALGRLDD